MTKLKPCPFCGGRAVMHHVSAESMLKAEMMRKAVPPMIRCEECGAIVSFDDAPHAGMTLAGAERLWNARAAEEDRRTVRTCRLEDNGAELRCSHCDCAYAYGEYAAFCRNCGRKVER